jgi:uncharacterized protein YutE (UPF0331/DUF86 family)
MRDARWLDVDADVASATRHFRNSVALYRAGGFTSDGLEGYRAQMAFMHAMQSAYNSAEAALMRILRLLDEEIPQGEDWHYKLIERLASDVSGDHARPALLPKDVAVDLHETRSFRHRVTHSYGDFDVSRAGPSVAAAGRLAGSFAKAIASFKEIVDPTDESDE